MIQCESHGSVVILPVLVSVTALSEDSVFRTSPMSITEEGVPSGISCSHLQHDWCNCVLQGNMQCAYIDMSVGRRRGPLRQRKGSPEAEEGVPSGRGRGTRRHRLRISLLYLHVHAAICCPYMPGQAHAGAGLQQAAVTCSTFGALVYHRESCTVSTMTCPGAGLQHAAVFCSTIGATVRYRGTCTVPTLICPQADRSLTLCNPS